MPVLSRFAAIVVAILLLLRPLDAARTFASATDIVSAGSASQVDLHTAFTVCAWVKPANTTSGGRVIQHGDLITSPFIEWNLRITTAGKVSVENQMGSAVGATTVATGTWQDWCGTWDGTTMTAWLNGTSDGTAAASGTMTHSTNLTEIGNTTAFSEAFAGDIAEVIVWNIGNNSAIVTEFHQRLPALLIRPQNIRGYWPLSGHQSPEPNYFGPAFGTVTGTSAAPHPFVMGR